MLSAFGAFRMDMDLIARKGFQAILDHSEHIEMKLPIRLRNKILSFASFAKFSPHFIATFPNRRSEKNFEV